ncbi:hypothetical protein MTR_2g050190 [Medicago truncatula]|uniref:Uncharacterized protein n=1 Tax=Medicago truncatula TaxID=3880 RepID=A0A072V7C9_MEDTR|nr:hypothetical protein MTR_2g050190 [Medicago truncatula]
MASCDVQPARWGKVARVASDEVHPPQWRGSWLGRQAMNVATGRIAFFHKNHQFSCSHVKLSPVVLSQTTLTRGISLPLNVFTFRSSIITGKVSTVRLSLTCTSSLWITWDV